MVNAAQGAQSNLAMDPVTPIDTNSEPYEFLSCDLRKVGTVLDTNAIRGTRSHAKEVTREGTYEIIGSITLNATPSNLDLFLPRILGAVESADSFPLAETLPSFSVGVDYGGTDSFEYKDCYVNRATFRASARGFLELQLDILGKTQIDLSYPSLTLGVATNDAPYIFEDGVLTMISAARPMMDCEIVIDNHLDARFTNSQTSTSITPQDRTISLRCTNPYTSVEVDLYTAAISGATSATLDFTNGTVNCLFTFGHLQWPQVTPTISGKVEIPLKIEAIARSSGATKELVITSDSAV